MGCFLACFGSSKDKKRRKRSHKVLPREQNKRGSFNGVEHTVSLAHTEKPSSPVSYHQRVVIKDTEKPGSPVPDHQEQLSLSCRKRVTFNSSVKTYDHDQVTEVSLVEKEEAPMKREENPEKPKRSESHSEDSSITSSSGSHPPNHRYQNCRDSDDELDYEECDIDDDEEEEEVRDEDFGEVDYDESENKLGSRCRGHGNRPIIEEIDAPLVKTPEREVKVNPSARDRSTYVHPVLNPIENLTQWKAVKTKGVPPLRNEINSEPCLESSFSFKASSDKSKKPNQEIAVDASLSNWLGTQVCTPSHNASSPGSVTNTPERRTPLGSTSPSSYDDRPILGALTVEEIKQISVNCSPKRSPSRSPDEMPIIGTVNTPERRTPPGSTSPSSYDDRPILGALTVEEIKQISVNCSPKRSPSRSPDEMPIIGTVGTYWNDSISDRDTNPFSTFKGIPNTSSKYREDKRVKWHTTPFEARLEKALNGEA